MLLKTFYYSLPNVKNQLAATNWFVEQNLSGIVVFVLHANVSIFMS